MTEKRPVPMRMCVGCNDRKEKRDLVRVVRTPEGEILLDSTGRVNGRGAYVCRRAECLTKAIKKNALSRSLHAKTDAALLETLLQSLQEEKTVSAVSGKGMGPASVFSGKEGGALSGISPDEGKTSSPQVFSGERRGGNG